MIRFDPSLRILVVGASAGLTIAACQLVFLGSDARDMAYPGGVSEEIAAESPSPGAVHAERSAIAGDFDRSPDPHPGGADRNVSARR